jgi:hypothetical protein
LRDPEAVNDPRPRRGVANFHSNFHRDKQSGIRVILQVA